jgi:hypothetical protein
MSTQGMVVVVVVMVVGEVVDVRRGAVDVRLRFGDEVVWGEECCG